MTQITTVSQLYPPKWLRPSHLQGQIYDLQIVRAHIEELRNPRTKKLEPTIVCLFKSMELAMPCNKTQSLAIAAIAKTEEFAKWAGTTIRVSPGMTFNNKATIIVTSPPTTQLTDIHVPNEESPEDLDLELDENENDQPHDSTSDSLILIKRD